MILVLVPVGMGLSHLIKIETKMVVSAKKTIRAFQLADAGIQRAMAEIVNNSAYTGTGAVQSLSTGQYTINISTPGSAFEGSILPANRYGIESIGYVPDMIQASETIKVVAFVNRIPFNNHGLFDFAVTAGDGGIDIRGSCLVEGDVITSGTANSQGSVTITGTVTDGDISVADFSPLVAPETAIDLGVINLNGNSNFTINPGTYTCTSINIGGNARITLNTIPGGDAVFLYCSGDIDAAGTGFVNTGADATKFFLYGTGESGNIDLHGTADIYAAVYAPKYNCFSRGNNLVTGAMNVYKYDSNGNPDMIYDANLNGIGGVGGIDQVKILSWREEKI